MGHSERQTWCGLMNYTMEKGAKGLDFVEARGFIGTDNLNM